MPIRTKVLKGAFVLYAICSLISMATMSIAAVTVVFAFFITTFPSGFTQTLRSEIQKGWNHRSFRIYFYLSTLLFIAVSVSLMSGKYFPLRYSGLHSEVHFIKDITKTWYFFWPLILILGMRRLSEDDQQDVLKAWIFTFGTLSILGIFQYFTGWPRPQEIPGETHHYHATLFLGHHLSVSSILIFPFFANLDLIRSRKIQMTWLYIGIAILGAITLFLTYSRTLWVALPIGFLIWVLWSLPKRISFWILGITLVGMVALSQYSPVHRRMVDALGIGPRQELWLANLEFFKQRPLFGVGLRHNQELSGLYLMEKYHTNEVFSGHAHNNLIDMLGGIGAIGTLSWIAWNMGWFWILIQKSRSSPSLDLTRGLVCAWVVFHLNGLTQVNFWEAKVQHQIAWVIAWALL
jgi:O-antigen ligase